MKKKLVLRPEVTEVKAFAPATVSNLAVGFDLLGQALKTPGDELTLRKTNQEGVKLVSVKGVCDVPVEQDKNTASLALSHVMDFYQLNSFGFEIELTKNIPLASGLGGSAASAVAALIAFNGFLQEPLSKEELLPHAVYAESVISGGAHFDNVAPALWGGLVLCSQEKIVTLPPIPLKLLVFHPSLRVETKKARSLLPTQVNLGDCISYAGTLARFVHNLYNFEVTRFQELLQDFLIEPCRMELWPHYASFKEKALSSGALGVCISGSGPTILVWCDEEEKAYELKEILQQNAHEMGWTSDAWISSDVGTGAHITKKV